MQDEQNNPSVSQSLRPPVLRALNFCRVNPPYVFCMYLYIYICAYVTVGGTMTSTSTTDDRRQTTGNSFSSIQLHTTSKRERTQTYGYVLLGLAFQLISSVQDGLLPGKSSPPWILNFAFCFLQHGRAVRACDKRLLPSALRLP